MVAEKRCRCEQERWSEEKAHGGTYRKERMPIPSSRCGVLIKATCPMRPPYPVPGKFDCSFMAKSRVRSSEMQNAKCKTQNAKCQMHNAQCTMHNAQCTMHNAQCTMHNAQCTMRDRANLRREKVPEACSASRKHAGAPIGWLDRWMAFARRLASDPCPPSRMSRCGRWHRAKKAGIPSPYI